MIQDNDCQLILKALPSFYLILKPDAPHFTIVEMSDAFAKAISKDKEDIEKGLFEVFTESPDNPGGDGVRSLMESLRVVLETKRPHQMSTLRFDTKSLETHDLEIRYWLPVNTPVLNENGEIIYIGHTVKDITAEVLVTEIESKSQQELRHLHNEQSQILESIADGFISTDQNWIVRYWNRQAERIFNVSRNDILGRYLWDVIKESYAKKLYECFHEAMNKNKPVYFEKYYAVQDKWLQINVYPSDKGITAFLVDISENRKAQEVIQYNERRFRALIDNISDGLAIISPTGLILDVSYSGKKILGYRSRDLIDNYIYRQLIHPADFAKVQEAFFNVKKNPVQNPSYISKLMPSTVQSIFKSTESQIGVEFRVKMNDGTYKWVEGTFHNLLHEETIKAIVLNFNDITKRREQEEQLQASEEKYRYLFHNSPATILIWRLDDLCIQEVNQTALNLYGYTRNEFLGMSVLETRPVEEQERLISTALELRTKGSTNTGVWQIKTKRGDIVFMNLSFHKINYGNHEAVLSLGTNVTEKVQLQKKLDEERRQKQQEITEAVLTTQENERAELGKELHDNINQILTTTRLYIEHALSKNDKQEELLQHSHEYISKAIHEIRQLSRSLMPPSLGDVSLKHELEELFLSLKSLKEYKFKFKFLLGQEEMISDPLKLTIFRIIQEQMNNILKHAKATKITVSILQLDHKLKVLVKDNGIGFDPKKGPRGLGLRNITSRANLLGGQVEIHSEMGKGTELQVIFPIEKNTEHIPL